MAVVISNSMVVGKLNAGKLRPRQPGDIAAPNQLTAEQAQQIAEANNITPEQVSDLSAPDLIQAIAASNLDAPDLINSLVAEQIQAPTQISSEQAAQIQAARELDAISAPSISAPNQINAIPDDTSPPFDMRHARILYDNVLSDAATSSAGRLTLSPNTYERAISGGAGSITYTMPSNRAIDCVAVGAGSWIGVNVRVETSSTLSGSFITRAEVTPENNNPIMALFNSASVRRVRVSFGGAATVGVVSAGIALQMQRPIFGGHNPITMSRQTEYQSRRSESGNFVSRNIIRKGLSGSYEWSNLTDDWVREYFDPFIESARKLPFFIAWRPESYPDEVAYAWTTGDISPSNIGTRNLMSVGMDVQAYGD